MTDVRSVAMDAEARESFLGVGGTGVLSFPAGVDEPPYSLPVSYGYDDTDGSFYFRLGTGPDREKTTVLDGESRPVSFVTYGQPDDRWQSVVATGELTEITDAEMGSDAVQGLGRTEIPLVDIFGRSTTEVTFRFFRLDPETVTGRVEQPTA